jgi:hypothetical protein
MSCIRLRGDWKLFCIVILLLSMFAHAQQPRRALNNVDIIKMTHDGLDENVIVALVESNPTSFDVSIDGLTSLKTAGVSGKVMEAMLKAEARNRQGSTAALSAVGDGAPRASPAAVTGANAAMPAAGGDLSQIMAMAMSMSMGRGGMPGMGNGMLDPSHLPPLVLISSEARLPIKPSIAQIANTQTKGDGMPGAGSQAAGMLMGFGRQALSFGMIGGGMFAEPGAGMAMGMMGGLGGLGHHHGPPKITYVWVRVRSRQPPCPAVSRVLRCRLETY